MFNYFSWENLLFNKILKTFEYFLRENFEIFGTFISKICEKCLQIKLANNDLVILNKCSTLVIVKIGSVTYKAFRNELIIFNLQYLKSFFFSFTHHKNFCCIVFNTYVYCFGQCVSEIKNRLGMIREQFHIPKKFTKINDKR